MVVVVLVVVMGLLHLCVCVCVCGALSFAVVIPFSSCGENIDSAAIKC